MSKVVPLFPVDPADNQGVDLQDLFAALAAIEQGKGEIIPFSEARVPEGRVIQVDLHLVVIETPEFIMIEVEGSVQRIEF